MAQYIDKDAIVAEIENLLDKGIYHEEYDCAYRDGNNGALYALKNKLDTLEVKDIETPKVPKHSYFETIYHCGTEPMWKIGDTLAVYEFYSDREGEHVYGKVVDVRNDETYDDWVYTMKRDFGEYEDMCENELISQQAYRKNK